MFRSSRVAALGFIGLACACGSKTDEPAHANTTGHPHVAQHDDASTGAVSDAATEALDAAVPVRPIVVSDDRPMETFVFFPEEANPVAVPWYPTEQVARFRRSLNGDLLPVRAKLVVVLNGVGNAAGPGEVAQWLADRGFHTFALDYHNNSSVRLLPDSVPDDDLPGAIEAYSEIIEGDDTSPNVEVSRADSVLGRLDAGLQYLSAIDPGADWGYYLNPDGSARLTDIIFFGYSFGGATATVVGKRHLVDRVIAASAPRYAPIVNDAWEAGPSVTPLERFYAIVGTLDPDIAEIEATINGLGWPGEVVDTTVVPPPYNGSHRLQNNQGHSAMCLGTALDPVCEYAFGISH